MPHPDQRQHRRSRGRWALTYGNFLFSAVGSAFNIGVDPADRWLCCLPLSHVAGLSIVLRSVIYGTTAVLLDGFDTEQVASTLSLGRDHGALAGADDADPPARGRGRPLRPAGDPDRRRAGARGRARGGPRPRGDGGPDLRDDRDLLPGDHPRARGRPQEARLGRPAAAHHPRPDRGRRDPRPGPDRRARRPRPRRLAAYRRSRPHRRGGLPLRHRPPQRGDRHGRRERDAGGGRVRAARPSRPSPTWRCSAAPTPSGRRRSAPWSCSRRARRPSEEELREHSAVSLARFKVPKRIDFVGELPRSPSGKLLRASRSGSQR